LLINCRFPISGLNQSAFNNQSAINNLKSAIAKLPPKPMVRGRSRALRARRASRYLVERTFDRAEHRFVADNATGGLSRRCLSQAVREFAQTHDVPRER
jgi:hypothetical protein